VLQPLEVEGSAIVARRRSAEVQGRDSAGTGTKRDAAGTGTEAEAAGRNGRQTFRRYIHTLTHTHTHTHTHTYIYIHIYICIYMYRPTFRGHRDVQRGRDGPNGPNEPVTSYPNEQRSLTCLSADVTNARADSSAASVSKALGSNRGRVSLDLGSPV
jgi:hypothetical protein